MGKGKTLNELVEVVKNFCEDRKWKNDDPNQLVTSMMIELGELAENYQWSTKFKELNEEEKRSLGYEYVDVLFDLFRLADKSDVDLEKYFLEKIPKLEAKFPIGQNSKEHNEIKETYRKTGKNKLYE